MPLYASFYNIFSHLKPQFELFSAQKANTYNGRTLPRFCCPHWISLRLILRLQIESLPLKTGPILKVTHTQKDKKTGFKLKNNEVYL